MLRVLAMLLQALPAQNFPPVERPGVPQLSERIHATCGLANDAVPRDALVKRELQMASVANGSRATADAWAALACIRGLLWIDGAISHDGPAMISGASWIQGGQNAAMAGLALQPSNRHAAEILGILAAAAAEPEHIKEVSAALVAAVHGGARTPPVLRGCADLAARIADDAAARECAQAALASGADSTWQLLRLSRLAFRACDTAAGVRQFVSAADAAHDSVTRAEVDWHLQWFLTPAERTSWQGIPDTLRVIWLRNQLVSRDVRDGQPLGARLAEHFGRLEFVEKNFRLDVARVMRNGIRTSPAVLEDGRTPPNPDQRILAALEPGAVNARMWRDYDRWQAEFDDRGVVWMRFGKPLKRIPWSCPGECSIVREAWLYEIDGRTMVLSFEDEGFDGSAQATRLVTGVLGSYFCDIDARRCGDNERSIATYWARAAGNRDAMLLFPEEVEQVRHQDNVSVAIATTQDDNSPRGDQNVNVTSRLHRLWDPLSGEPFGLLTYALPVKDLSVQQNGGQRTALVDLELREWDPAADQWRDTTFTRRFELPDTSVRRPNLVGFVIVPTSPSVASWGLVATQPDHRRGRAYDVSTPGLPDGPVQLSDLVIGAEAQGVTWNLHNVAIPLAPVNAVDRSKPVALYYQIRSETTHADLKGTVVLYKQGGSEPALEVTFEQAVRAGINEVAPTLDVSRLDKGSYRLEVRIIDPRGTVITRRSVAVELE
jgi:hypothetical protein